MGNCCSGEVQNQVVTDQPRNERTFKKTVTPQVQSSKSPQDQFSINATNLIQEDHILNDRFRKSKPGLNITHLAYSKRPEPKYESNYAASNAHVEHKEARDFKKKNENIENEESSSKLTVNPSSIPKRSMTKSEVHKSSEDQAVTISEYQQDLKVASYIQKAYHDHKKENNHSENEIYSQEKSLQGAVDKQKLESDNKELEWKIMDMKRKAEIERINSENQRLADEKSKKDYEREKSLQESRYIQKAEQERINQERYEEKIKQKREEYDRKKEEELQKKRIEESRIYQEKQREIRIKEEERLRLEKLEKERIMQEAGKFQLEEEKLRKNKPQQQQEDSRIFQQRIEEKLRKDQEERLRIEKNLQEKEEQKKASQEKIRLEKITKLEEDQKIRQENLRLGLEQERLNKEKQSLESLRQEKLKQERIKQEKLQREAAEWERMNREKMEQEKLRLDKEEKSKIERVQKDHYEQNKGRYTGDVYQPKSTQQTQLNQQTYTQDYIRQNKSVSSTIPKYQFAPFGLENISNTCYMNSTLQCLLSLPKFVRSIYKNISSTNGSLSKAFNDLFKVLSKLNPNESLNRQELSTFKSSLAKFDNYFADSRQKDASRLISVILSTLEEEIGDEIFNMFYIQYNSGFSCSSCGKLQSYQDDFMNMLCLSANYPDVVSSLEESLKISSRSKCCNSLCKNQWIKIKSIGNYLILKLEKANLSSGYKTNQIVKFSTTQQIDLSKFIERRKPQERFTYELAGFINHKGDLDFGHYFSIYKHPMDGRWIKANDGYVDTMTERDVNYHINNSDSPLILFYQKSE